MSGERDSEGITNLRAMPPADVTLRPARVQDAVDMAGLVRAAYGPYVCRIGREPAPMTADYAHIATTGNAWVAEQHGRLVGLVVLEPHEDYMLLENVAVAPDTQGRSVGGQLLQLAEDEALASGLSEVRLYTNEAMTQNIPYYLHRGYRRTHHGMEDGFRRVYFAKRLPSSKPRQSAQ